VMDNVPLLFRVLVDITGSMASSTCRGHGHAELL